MDDSSRTRIVPRRPESVKFSSAVNISSRRSLSSSSSGDSQKTPLHPLGVPFSWEKLPGEPKEFPYHRKNESSNNLLPLPPHRRNQSPNNTRRKKNTITAAMRDPFTAALVECSKGASAEGEHTDGESRNVVRKSSIGLVNLYASCRRACAVSESIVYLPRSIDRVASYDHLLLNTSRRRR